MNAPPSPGKERPRTDRCEEAGDPGAACTNGLGERSLRHERRLDLTCVYRRDRFGVRGEVRGDAALDPALAQELPEPATRLADVVRDDRQLVGVGAVDEGVDERERRTDEPETADHHRVTRADRRHRLRRLDRAARNGHTPSLSSQNHGGAYNACMQARDACRTRRRMLDAVERVLYTCARCPRDTLAGPLEALSPARAPTGACASVRGIDSTGGRLGVDRPVRRDEPFVGASLVVGRHY